LAQLTTGLSDPEVAAVGPLLHEGGTLDFACVAISREKLKEIGPLDETLPVTQAVSRWCQEATAKGFKLQALGSSGAEGGIVQVNFPMAYSGAPESSTRWGFVATYTRRENPRVKNVDVTAHISTLNRHATTLPLVLQAVAFQTMVPKELLLFNDSPDSSPFSAPLYANLFSLLSQRGCTVSVIQGDQRGQVSNHQAALNTAEYDLLWRLDDDDSPEPDVLQTLLSELRMDVGGVASLVHSPWSIAPEHGPLFSGQIKHIRSHSNVQWADFKHTESVEHLHNTFLFRKNIVGLGYHSNLSPVGHREETMFTHEILKRGWKLLVAGKCITWHMRDPQGGIRNHANPIYYAHDEQVFDQWAKNLGIKFQSTWPIVLNEGLGDHLAFLHVLPAIKEKAAAEGKCIQLFVTYPEVFASEATHSIAEAIALFGDIARFSIYNFMIETHWKGTLLEAFHAFHGV
jgi:hypothetical protein